jgi:hypothetical protein
MVHPALAVVRVATDGGDEAGRGATPVAPAADEV